MDLTQARQEMEYSFGFTPAFLATVPDAKLPAEWDLMKQLGLEEKLIPNKYKELMGLALAAATRCQYCIYYHTVVAKLFGATDDEIQEAMHYTKHVSGWSTYMNGMSLDLEQFKQEMDRIADHVRNMMAAPSQ